MQANFACDRQHVSCSYQHDRFAIATLQLSALVWQITFRLCWRFEVRRFYDHDQFVLCNDSYYLDLIWRLLAQLDRSSGPFCPFLRSKSITSKINQNHCKNYGFGNMSLLEGTQIGSKMALFSPRKIVQKPCKLQQKRQHPPPFGARFSGIFTSTGARFSGIQASFFLLFSDCLECFLGELFFCYARTTSSLICKLQYFRSKTRGTSMYLYLFFE